MPEEAKTQSQVDVLIVGAGPTGLFLATELALFNIPFRIIDRNFHPTTQSRAIGITPRTMEVLDSRGLSEAVLKDAVISEGAKLYDHGHYLATFNVMDHLPSPFPFLTLLEQHKTERIFTERLTEYHKSIERGVELVRYDVDAEGGVAVVKKNVEGEVGEGVEEEIRFKYLVGADGAHSKVRKGWKDGWKYGGQSIKTTFFLADITFDSALSTTNPTHNHFHMFSHSTGMIGLLPLSHPPNAFRVIGNIDAYEVSSSTAITHGVKKSGSTLTLETIQKIMDERATPLKLVINEDEVEWITEFQINERLADGFERGGRVFLCGDAGHCHSPVGGQGMNLGITDAHNLAWKLAHSLLAPSTASALLKSYSPERIPVARSVVQNSSQGTTIVSSGAWWARLARSWFLPILTGLDAVKDRAGLVASQCGVQYGEGRWAIGVGKTEEAKWGEKLFPTFKSTTRTPTTLHSILRSAITSSCAPTYALLLLIPHPPTTTITIPTLPHTTSIIIRPYNASSALPVDPAVTEYLDYTGEVLKSFGVDGREKGADGVMVLVRPDGVVGGVVEFGEEGLKRMGEVVGVQS
ncbi:hypothetical protein HK097_009050 [Rhizophlyctis rosea]|uniref:FAD-binding domain-containing protein n=1 Tax=Rhizophlyctis rosea TaxID=64517 RepID=A0AAD5SCI5_9FUNG|nr:hypothetical protein HK097_009050 [Rhizophlyctis rosea]